MRNIPKYIIGTLIALLVFTGCNETVPQGTVGKILTKNGFEPEVYVPSRVWINNGITAINPDKLILVESTTEKYNEPITVVLQDKLELSADIIFRCRINTSDPKILNPIFNDIKLDDTLITTKEVYNIYAKMIVLNTARDVISKYNVDEVNVNYGRITTELYLAIKPKLQGLPIEISDVTLGSIKYPKIVTEAIEKSTERRMYIEQENANVQIALAKAKGQEEVAKATYNIKMLEAAQIRDYNKMIASGLTPELIKLKELELDKYKVDAYIAEVEKWNGVKPTTMVNGSTPTMLLGK